MNPGMTMEDRMQELEARYRELEQRVGPLEDRDQIAALVTRYYEVVDAHDADALKGLFTDDAGWYWANGLVEARGIDEVMEALAGRWHTIGASFHVGHGHLVELDPNDPDRATGVAFSHAEVLRQDNPMISALRYDDQYLREAGVWRFQERKLSFFYYVSAASYVDDLVSGTPVRNGDTRLSADLRRGR